MDRGPRPGRSPAAGSRSKAEGTRGRTDRSWCGVIVAAHPTTAILFQLAPFELRDFGTFEEDTDFGGTTFPAGEPLRSGYVAYDWRFRYRYELLPESIVNLKVGGALSLLDTLTELAVIPGDENEELDFTRVADTVLAPLLHLHIGVSLSRKLMLFAEADGIEISDERYLDATAQLRYQVSRQWDVAAGIRRIERIINTDDLSDEHDRYHLVLSVAYRW